MAYLLGIMAGYAIGFGLVGATCAVVDARERRRQARLMLSDQAEEARCLQDFERFMEATSGV